MHQKLQNTENKFKLKTNKQKTRARLKQKKKEHGIFKFPFYLGINYLCWGFPGGGNGNPLQFYFLENPMDRGAWRAAVHRVAKNQI